jgi:excisionase family DNA binding protein
MQLWTVREVALRLAVAPITVRRLIAEGKLPAVRIKKSVRVRAEDVESLIRMAGNYEPQG